MHPPALQAITFEDLPAHEAWLDSAAADDGRLRVVLLAQDADAAQARLRAAAPIVDALAAHRARALDWLWRAEREDADPLDPPAAFVAGFAASDLVLSDDGGFQLHLAPRDAAWFPAGYWPCVRFSAAHAPVSWVCES